MYETIKKKVLANYSRVLSIYVTVFCCYAILGWIALFNIQHVVQSILSLVFAGVGVLLLLAEILFVHKFKEVPHYKWLFLFLVAIAVSAIANGSYGWADNAKTFIWSCIQIGLMVPLVIACEKEDLKRMTSFFFKFIFPLWTVCALVSIGLYAVQLGYAFVDTAGKLQRQGFIDGRLFGIFIDPNYAACFSLCLIIMAIYVLRKWEMTRLVRALVFAGIIINGIYFALAESRTGFLALAVIAVVYIIICFKHTSTKDSDTVFRKASAGWKSVGVVFAVTALLVLNVSLAHSYASFVQESDIFGFNESTERFGDRFTEREDMSTENISNNRFDIWSDYMYVMKDHGALGLSPRNAGAIILDEYPDLYISTRNKDSIYGVHNGYLSVFVYTGILGLVALIAVAFYSIVSLVRILRHSKDADLFLLCMLMIFLVICVKAVTHEIPFFTYSGEADIFWIALGALLVCGAKKKKDPEKADTEEL